MTAEDWDRETFDAVLLGKLGCQEHGLARKRRLYLAALCRRFWDQLPTPEACRAVEAAESYADGRLSREDLSVVHQALLNAHVSLCAPGKRVVRRRGFQLSAYALNSCDPDKCYLVPAINATISSHSVQIRREIFGNPFRHVAFDPRWRTADVVDLAQAIYDSRSFNRLSVLGDALIDAGCEDEQIVAHCRSEGPHVRGCWVVDLVLDKQ